MNETTMCDMINIALNYVVNLFPHQIYWQTNPWNNRETRRHLSNSHNLRAREPIWDTGSIIKPFNKRKGNLPPAKICMQYVGSREV